MLPCDVKDLPDQVLEEEEDTIQALGAGSPSSPMFGDELMDEDLLDY